MSRGKIGRYKPYLFAAAFVVLSWKLATLAALDDGPRVWFGAMSFLSALLGVCLTVVTWIDE